MIDILWQLWQGVDSATQLAVNCVVLMWNLWYMIWVDGEKKKNKCI